MFAVCAPNVIRLVSVRWRRRSGSKTWANSSGTGHASRVGSGDRAGPVPPFATAAASSERGGPASPDAAQPTSAITPPIDVVARIIRWTSRPRANASSRGMPEPVGDRDDRQLECADVARARTG